MGEKEGYLQKKDENSKVIDFMIRILVKFIDNSVLSSAFFGQKSKVAKILKDSLDSIPSPSPLVKIQVIGGKVYLR